MYKIKIIPACVTARLSAWMIDSVISLVMIIGLMIYLGGTADIERFLLGANYTEVFLVIGIPVFVHVFITSTKQRTLGMLALDLQIITEEGELAEWGHYMRRPIGLIGTVLTAGLSLLIPMFNDRRRTLGDMISGTRVVETLAIGERISYDAWRIFKGILKPLAPVSLAIAIGALLLNKQGRQNSDILLDAAVIAVLMTMIIGITATALKVKTTQVRIGPHGVVKSGLLGWSSKITKWDEIEYIRIRHKRIFSYFEVHGKNRRKFRIPIESNSAQLTANTIVANQIRMEH